MARTNLCGYRLRPQPGEGFEGFEFPAGILPARGLLQRGIAFFCHRVHRLLAVSAVGLGQFASHQVLHQPVDAQQSWLGGFVFGPAEQGEPHEPRPQVLPRVRHQRGGLAGIREVAAHQFAQPRQRHVIRRQQGGVFDDAALGWFQIRQHRAEHGGQTALVVVPAELHLLVAGHVLEVFQAQAGRELPIAGAGMGGQPGGDQFHG